MIWTKNVLFCKFDIRIKESILFLNLTKFSMIGLLLNKSRSILKYLLCIFCPMKKSCIHSLLSKSFNPVLVKWTNP